MTWFELDKVRGRKGDETPNALFSSKALAPKRFSFHVEINFEDVKENRQELNENLFVVNMARNKNASKKNASNKENQSRSTVIVSSGVMDIFNPIFM